MPIYCFRCVKCQEIFEEQSKIEHKPEFVDCPKCSSIAERYLPAEKFSGRVRGGYGGGPITK